MPQSFWTFWLNYDGELVPPTTFYLTAEAAMEACDSAVEALCAGLEDSAWYRNENEGNVLTQEYCEGEVPVALGYVAELKSGEVT
jgi:hypothetical protein